jgi:hypothetical protein
LSPCRLAALAPRRTGSPARAFGYVIEGEMIFELKGEPERVVRAGETFWEPGGDMIHYQDGKNLADAQTRFVVTMFGVPGQPMFIPVSPEELEERRPAAPLVLDPGPLIRERLCHTVVSRTDCSGSGNYQGPCLGAPHPRGRDQGGCGVGLAS